MAEEIPTPSGLAQAGVIDFFAHDPQRDEVVLAMFETRPWDDSELQLFQLQEKFNAYVSFLLDGEMAEAHPELAGKKTRIEVRCASVPAGRALDLLTMIHDQLVLQEIEVEVIAGSEGGCGNGCTCHGEFWSGFIGFYRMGKKRAPISPRPHPVNLVNPV